VGIVQMTGFEHGSSLGLRSGITGQQQFDFTTGVEGTQLVVQNSNAHVDGYALRCVATTAAQANVYWTTASMGTPTVLVGRMWFCVESLAGAGGADLPALMHISTAVGSASTSYLEYDEPTGNLHLTVGGGTTQIATAVVTVGQWVAIDWRFDCSGSTWTWDWMVNGVTQTQATWSHAASTFSEIRFGINSAYNITLSYDDITLSTTANDYPLPDTHIVGLPVNGSGTHSIPGDFQQTINNGSSGGAISSPELLVDDLPPTVGSGTDAVYQATASASAYLEFTHPPISATAVYAVKHIVAGWVSSGSAKSIAVVLLDGASSGNTLGAPGSPVDPTWAWSSSVVHGWANKTYAAPPSGGAWTPALVNALRTRFGYAGAVAGLPGMNAAYLEVATASAASLHNMIEGTDTVAVDAIGSGLAGRRFSIIATPPTGGSHTYSAVSGATYLKQTLGATSGNNYARYDEAQLLTQVNGARLSNLRRGCQIIQYPAHPATSTGFLTVTDAAFHVIFHLRITSAGILSVRDWTDTQILASTSALTTGADICVRWRFTLGTGATQQITVAYWNNAAGTGSPVQTLTTSVATTATTPAYYFHGTTYGGTTGTILQRGLKLSDQDVAQNPFDPIVQSSRLGAMADTGFSVGYDILNTTAVRLAVSTSSAMTSPTYFGPSTPSADHLGKISATGLTAATDYWWQFECDSVLTGPIGRATTYPTAGSQASFSFAAGSSLDNEVAADSLNKMRVFTGSGGRRPSFFAWAGHYHYDARTPANDEHLYLSAYRNQANASPYLRRTLREVPLAYTPSDYDFGQLHSSAGIVSAPAVQSVYRKYFPSYTLPDSGTKGVWQTWAVGRVRFIMTDGRSYASTCTATDGASKTKLGSEQLAWLQNLLDTSTEPVIFWIDEGEWSNGPHSAGDNTAHTFTGGPPATEINSDDSWEAYAYERGLVLSHFAGKHVYLVAGGPRCLAADDGTNVTASVPLAVVAKFDRAGDVGLGTYTQGRYPAIDNVQAKLFGFFDVTDNGSNIVVDYSGVDYTGVQRISMHTVFSLYTNPVTYWNGTTEQATTVSEWDGTTENTATVSVV